MQKTCITQYKSDIADFADIADFLQGDIRNHSGKGLSNFTE